MHKYNSLTRTYRYTMIHINPALRVFHLMLPTSLERFLNVSSAMKVLFGRRIDGSRLDNHINTTVDAFDGGMVILVIWNSCAVVMWKRKCYHRTFGRQNFAEDLFKGVELTVVFQSKGSKRDQQHCNCRHLFWRQCKSFQLSSFLFHLKYHNATVSDK